MTREEMTAAIANLEQTKANVLRQAGLDIAYLDGQITVYKKLLGAEVPMEEKHE